MIGAPGALGAVAARLVVDPLLATLFPSRCASCSSPQNHPTQGPLCPSCWANLPRHQGRVCRCGEPLHLSWRSACGRCRRGRGTFSAGISLGPYQGSLRVLVHQLKYRGRRGLAQRLAELLLREDATRGPVMVPQAVLVPVPLHPARLRQRGYNQAALLAAALASRARLPIVEALVRRQNSPPQTGLSAAARRRNVADAFRARRQGEVAGRVVVLVDDVFTTGATARACARVLLEAGVREVRLVTLARVA